MNTLSSLLKFIGDTIGAAPSTLTTTSKTLVGAINEVDSDIDDVENNLKTLVLPSYASRTAVLTSASDKSKTATIETDGWYLIDARGYWDSVMLYINDLQVFVSQKTGDNTQYVTDQCLFPIRAGATVRIYASGSASATLYKIT